MNNCNYCEGKLELTFQNSSLKVGTCSICKLKQQFSFDHINIDLYETNTNLPTDFKEERIRQKSWNSKRCSLLSEYFGNLEDKTVLDYGSGTGGFLEHTQNIFNKVIGFDISKEACEINNRDCLECVNNLDELDTLKPDLITLFHVLEHIISPVKFLKSITKHFRGTDYFAIEVPHTDEALISIYDCERYHNNHYCFDHLWYFTDETLRTVLQQSGLTVVYSSQIQRYSLANHLKWLSGNENEDDYSIFDDINDDYMNLLVKNNIADSLFMICSR